MAGHWHARLPIPPARCHAGVSPDAPTAPRVLSSSGGGCAPCQRRSPAPTALASVHTPSVLPCGHHSLVPLPTPCLSPLGKENCSYVFCPNTRSLQTPLEVRDRKPGFLQVSARPPRRAWWCVLHLPVGRRCPTRYPPEGSIQVLGLGHWLSPAAWHPCPHGPGKVTSHQKHRCPHAGGSARQHPSRPSPAALIPPQRTFNQEIKTNCLEIKPLMLSNQHTSCPQQQMHFSIFLVNGSLFGAGPRVRMLRRCECRAWPVRDAAGTDTGKTQGIFSDLVFKGGFSKWLCRACCAESCKKIPTEVEPAPWGALEKPAF